MEGSTDITRTFAFGKLSDQMKEDFTTVLKCNLHLARAVFLYGTTGYNLDAPVKKGEKAGAAEYYLGDKKIGSVDIVAAQDIREIDMKSVFEDLIQLILL